MLGPFADWDLPRLLVHIDKSGFFDTTAHFVHGVDWLSGFGKGRLEDVAPLGPGRVGWEGAVVTAYFCAGFELLDPAAWCEVTVGVLG